MCSLSFFLCRLLSLSGLLCLLGGSADTGYLYQRIWLSVTVFTSVIFLSLVLVDDYLICLALLEDLSLYCITFYEWCADNKLVTAYSYYFVEYDLVANVSNELLNSELVSLLYSLPPVLMIAYIISNSSLHQTRRSLGATLENPLRAVNRKK